MARAAMRDLDCIWGSRVALQMKVRLYNICVRSNALYASETWSVTQSDSDRIDTFDQWCLRRICGVCWSNHITNMEILHLTSEQAVVVVSVEALVFLLPVAAVRKVVGSTPNADRAVF